VHIEMMLSVASSPSMVAPPNTIPSMTRSRRITMPARVDFLLLLDFLKLSATANTLTPFFSEWTLRAIMLLFLRRF
jgi:hypothetical protein